MIKVTRRSVVGGLSATALSQRAGAQTATLVRYPYLQNVGKDRATILWTTLEEGSGFVEYAADRSYSQSATAQSRRFGTTETGLRFAYYQHQADLTGLRAGTEYFYRVMVDGQDLTPGVEQRFRTAGPGPFTFLVFGDSGDGSAEQLQVARLMVREPAALVLHTGDLVYPSGTFELFQRRYFDIYSELMRRVPLFPCPGIHEYFSNSAAAYVAVHWPPSDGVPASDRGRYYSFDWGNVHFISLDTNSPLADAVRGTGAMLEWLENDLRKTRQFWRVVYFHHTPYPNATHEGDPVTALARDRIVPILERYDVQLVLSGHEHNYQQTRTIRNGQAVEPGAGILYITSGGGGASLYPVVPRLMVAYAESAHHYVRAEVQGHRMTLRAVRADGQEIDNLAFAPVPLISSNAVVNAASFEPSLAPGGLVSIFGRQLGAEDSQASSLPLPTELAGINAMIGGRRLPLLYASPMQINCQLPFDLQGSLTLRVSTPNGSAETAVMISEVAPAIFSPGVFHADGTPVSESFPAAAGESILMFLTGLGAVTGEIAAGRVAPFSPLLTVRAPVEVRLGIISVMPSFAGLAPGFVGLYQVNARIPEGLPAGTYQLRVVARGVSSNSVNVAVRFNS